MSIRLDEKHGVNPTMSQCFFCGKDKDVLLIGKPKKEMYEQGLCESDGRMKTRIGVIDMEPCNECADYMKQGIILISVKNEDVNSKNPYRTGGWVVVKEDALDNSLTDPEMLRQIKKVRFCFVPDNAWDYLGLPRGNSVDRNKIGE
jgi:hypothetical protein